MQLSTLRQPSTPITRAFHINSEENHASREDRIKEALLLILCDPVPRECLQIWRLSDRDWRRALFWLDISGLALYLLDRLIQLGLCEMLPPWVLERLQQNLIDNTQRIAGMMEESNAINHHFQKAGLSYALLKGFSLWPHSVPRLELRSQSDIDFLIGERDGPEARRILEDRGFVLSAIDGREWRFKLNELRDTSLRNMYKPTRHLSVELHLETSTALPMILGRTEDRLIYNTWTPVLAPTDLLIGQGLHLYKHTCGEHSRAMHLVEFRRHVLARAHDARFWSELREIAAEYPRAPVALGVVTLLATRAMGSFAPEAFTSWTVDRVPQNVRLWIDIYGTRSVYASSPGTKMYLLLQEEMEAFGFPRKRSTKSMLLPHKLPHAVMPRMPNETLAGRWLRVSLQIRLLLRRVRFHIVQDLAFLIESRRWRRRLKRV